MQRSSFFHHPAHEPLRQNSSFTINHAHTRGPFSFLNPTRARLHSTLSPISAAQPSSSKKVVPQSQRQNSDQISSPDPSTPTSPIPSEHQEKDSPTSINFEWRSRDNRKGRHKLLVTPQSSSSPTNYVTPPSTISPRHILHIIYLQLTYAPVWDVSYLVAVIFTLGSAIWVINAFFVWLPIVLPHTEFPGEVTVAGGWTAFVGATIFEIGSVLLMFEAVNANKSGCFGWALEKVLMGDEEHITIRAKKEGCAHHQSNSKNFVGKGAAAKSLTNGKEGMKQEEDNLNNDQAQVSNTDKSWQWFPSWHDLTHHYIYELGFLACAFQMFGATVFYISGFTAIPQIYNMLTTDPAVTGAYWVPQIVGGCGFIISSLFFMLETQRKWYIPAPLVLGWHIGLWNLVGAVGFTLCGVFGLYDDVQYWADQASLATFWGSWAFLLGSVLQWYESLDTHPVEIKKQA